MAFVSRYESVRKVRELSVQKTERVFMEALSLLDRHRGMLRDLDLKRVQGVSFVSGQEGTFEQTAAWRSMCYDYVRWIDGEVERISALMETLSEEVNRCREEWQRSRREIEKINHLMEEEVSGHRSVLIRREERSQEDLTLSRWGKVPGDAFPDAAGKAGLP